MLEYVKECWAAMDARQLTASALVALACLAGYLSMRRRLRNLGETSANERMRLRFLGLGLALLAFFASARIWMKDAGPQMREINQNLLYTVAVGVVLYFISTVLQIVLSARAESLEVKHKSRRAIAWGAVFFFLAAAIFIWSGKLGDVSVFLGIVGAGLAMSLQETILCMAGWLLIIFRKPFDLGDRLEIEGVTGDVIDIGLFQTSLLEIGNWVKADQSTGRMLVVPNSRIFRSNLFNYTKGFPFIWNELSITVTYESDWEAAKEILLRQALDEADKLEHEVQEKIRLMQREYAIQYAHFTPIIYTSIGASGVELTLRYLAPVRERRTTEHRIAEAILKEIVPHPRIDFAYPTSRVFRNSEEGKPPLRPPAMPS